MGILLVLVAVVLFALADYIIRNRMRKVKENKLRQEREQVLTKNLELDFSFESESLNRVEVENPVARILAVDDEEIILDSFRKILVLDGYSVDTVQTGQEALGLIQKHDYDFVFTDLKMPEMSGVDVCKGVKHLRPDIDVIIITGYASVETAVETLKYGAMDYIQKPFTEDELLTMVRKFVIRREENKAILSKSKVFIVHKDQTDVTDKVDYSIPGGIFIAKNHCWVSLTPDGQTDIGIDDFTAKIFGAVTEISLPELGAKVEQGDTLFTIKSEKREFSFQSPITGRVVANNTLLTSELNRLDETTYFDNWICRIEADALDSELGALQIGQKAVDFFNGDIEKLSKFIAKSEASDIHNLSEKECKTLCDGFFSL